MALTLRYAVRSDRGLVRGNNEDSVYAGPRLLAVADGMGGHAAGEVASKIVVAALEQLDDDRNIPDLITTLRESVAEANGQLAQAVDDDPDLEGMGTTLTAIRFAGTRIAVVHVGDSRGYLYRNGQLSQITHDDTYVQSLVDAGKLTSEEASHHPRKSVILRALNGTTVDPDISIREARRGDRYLLCSDGLTDVVTSTTLLETLSSGTPQGCVDRLIELALRGGGPDNITCVVADVVEDDSEVDNVPLVGGAVVDASGDDVRPTSPAARAARMTRDDDPTELAPKPKRGRRNVAIIAAAAVVLAAVLFGSYRWTQGQYYVGRSGDRVAIYRGVSGGFGPLDLNSVLKQTDVRYDDLTPAARIQVDHGITAASRADADAIVTRLLDSLLPICPTATPTPTRSPSRSPGATASRTSRPAGPATSTATRQPTATATAKPTATATAKPTATPRSTPSPTSVTPTATPTPHVDCRP